MNTDKDYGKWCVNPAPGNATGSMAQPAVVLCSGCGCGIKPTEDCLESWEYEFAEGSDERIDELTLYLCEQCWKDGRG